MDDVAPPQDATPSAANDYAKPADAPPANGGTDGAAAGAAAQDPSPAAGAAASSAPDAAMRTEDAEEGGLPSGGGGAAVGGGGGGGGGSGGGGSGNLYLRPIFFGNLSHNCLASDVENIFKTPVPAGNADNGEVKAPIALDRVDMKRGYCFVFLKDAPSVEEKDRIETYVAEISGMNISQVSNCLRAEFARGDGRVKRKEDERRKDISPNETLFVVNFHEETTKREDLQMLFEPYGDLVRIDMKRNYAFVQFKTIDEAIRAKEATNGGKLDQSEITVEFVARRMGDRGGPRDAGDRSRPPGRRYDDARGADRAGGGRGGYRGEDRPRRDEYRPRGGGGGGYRGDRYDDDYRRGGYRDDRRRRSRSRSRSPGYRRRSRSRSPPHERDYRSSRDEYRPSSRGGRDSYEDRERVERGYGRSEY